MTTKNSPNGQARKQLSDQIDRLDAVIDALSDGLNQAVAGAVEQAVGHAVSTAVASVLTELLTNPLVLARLRDALGAAAPPPAPPLDDEASRRQGPGARAWSWVSERVRTAANHIGLACSVAGRALRSTPTLAWSGLMAVGGLAGTLLYLTRNRLTAVAATALGWGRGLVTNAPGLLGRCLPTFA